MSPTPYSVHVLDGASVITASLLVYTGVRCWQSQISMAEMFGIPNATPDEVTFLQPMIGRNIAAALFIFIMTYAKERKLLGVFMICYSIAGFADAKLLMEHSRGQKVGNHIRGTCMMLTLGALLIKTASQ